MAGKYFYKNSDITNFFITGTSTVTGFSGINYTSGSSVLMDKPYNFNMTTPSGDTHEPEVVERHGVSMTARCYSIRIPNSRLQELHHLGSISEPF